MIARCCPMTVTCRVARRTWTGYSAPVAGAKSDQACDRELRGLIAAAAQTGAKLSHLPAKATSANGAWLPWRRLRP
jgi:hypothetical protein